jgi:hypothetical protein
MVNRQMAMPFVPSLALGTGIDYLVSSELFFCCYWCYCYKVNAMKIFEICLMDKPADQEVEWLKF